MTLAFLALTACASRSMKIPGPLGPVALDRPPPVHVLDLPRAGEDDAPPTHDAPAPAPRRQRREEDAFGRSVATAARRHIDRLPAGFRNDCSGFVMAAHEVAGNPIVGSTRTLWADAEARGLTHSRAPRPGDVAFFDNTYDRNRNGRRDDPLTHVAVVLEVDADGTILMAHGGTSKGRTTFRMNLRHPHDRQDADGKVLNDWLRARTKGEPEDAPRLAGELLRGFARFSPDGA